MQAGYNGDGAIVGHPDTAKIPGRFSAELHLSCEKIGVNSRAERAGPV